MGDVRLYQVTRSSCHELVEFDNQPTSCICLTGLQVDENAPAGTVVALVNAFDEDRNPKQTLTYTLVNDDGGRFQIVGKQLLKRLPANYEAKKAHTITVRVSDNGTPQQFVRKSTFHLQKSAIIVVTLLIHLILSD